MKILLISTNRNTLPMPVKPIGACIVAHAAEQAGHTVFFLDLMFTKSPLVAIAAALTHSNPDIVGLSVRNIDNNDMRDPVFFLEDLQRFVEVIRTRTHVPIILGGGGARRHARANTATGARSLRRCRRWRKSLSPAP